MSEQTMTPSRSYLMRSLNEWILDNGCTPYVLVDAGMPEVQVPQDYISNGQIVLNVSPTAVQGLSIDLEGLYFNARFGGVPMDVYVPMVAILAIYAKENGQGMVFGNEAGAPDPDQPPEPKRPKLEATDGDKKSDSGKSSKPQIRPSLKVVK